MTTRTKSLSANSRALQLRIELLGIEPQIWRRIVVPNSLTLLELHAVIQGAMGWQDYHLHMFEIGERRFEVPEDDQLSDGLPHSCGRHHFFAATSFNMALSSMTSASSFFSQAFSLQRLQPPGLRHLQAPVLGFPLVEAHLADPVPAAYIRRLPPGFLLPQDADDLFFCESTALNSSVSSLCDGLYPFLEEFSGLTSAMRAPASFLSRFEAETRATRIS